MKKMTIETINTLKEYAKNAGFELAHLKNDIFELKLTDISYIKIKSNTPDFVIRTIDRYMLKMEVKKWE